MKIVCPACRAICEARKDGSCQVCGHRPGSMGAEQRPACSGCGAAVLVAGEPCGTCQAKAGRS